MAQELATAVFSDGWTAVDHHPIVNVIMVSVLYTNRLSHMSVGRVPLTHSLMVNCITLDLLT